MKDIIRMAVFGLIIVGTSGQTKECPIESENIVYPNPTNCTTYFKCENGLPILVPCPTGLHYDQRYLTCTYPHLANCIATTTSTTTTTTTTTLKPTSTLKPTTPTPAITCPSDNENTVYPNPKDCETYFMCKGGEPVLTKCPIGLWYDWEYLTCGYPKDVYCEAYPISEIKCPVGNDNAIIPNPKDCTKYYRCKGGIAISTKCPEGLLFDWNLLTCTVPEKAYCKGSRPPPSGEVKCPAGNDNAIIPDPKDCTKYYSCKGGIPIPAKCPEGLLFDWNLLTCTVPEKAYCTGSRPPPSGEVKCPAGNDNAIIPDPKDCTKYYRCKGGIPIPAKCPEGLLFDWNLLTCTVPEKAYCTGSRPPPSGEVKCPAGNDNAIIPDPKDCTKYYSCKGGIPIPAKCPEGLLFDWNLLTCTVPEKAYCTGSRPPPSGEIKCPAGNDNAIIPDPKDCTKYYRCKGGIPIPAKCPEGLLFDWNLLTCTVPEKAYCTGSRPPPSGEVKCPAGNDNAIIPDPKDCTKYYRCKGGIAIPTKCPEGLLFDWNLLTCTVPEKAYCKGSRPPPSGEVKCPAGNDNAIIPDPKDCTKYYSCKGGIPIPAKCPEGLLFDWNLLTCTVPEKAYCTGSRPPPSGEIKCPAGNDNAIIPDPKDCTKYYRCKGGIPIPAKCPEGLLFDWNLLTCTVPEKAYCTGSRPPPSGEIKCPAGNDNAIIPDPKDCTKYYRCKGGIAISTKCPEGLLFDWNLLTCTVPEKAYCKGSRPPPSGEVKCPAGNDNAIIPDPKDCTKYYSCKGGIPIPAKCPEGLLFDWNLLTCTVPEKAYCTGSRPPPSGEVKCPAGNDNAIIPDPKDCTKYYRCKGGIPIPAKCPEGLLFDWNLLTCTVPEKAYCTGSRPPPSGEVKCPAGNDNAIIPDPKDCTKYYSCKGGIPIPAKCPEGLLFDWNLLTCTVPEKAYCTGSRPPPSGEIKCPAGNDNAIIPDPKDCTKYYRCKGGIPIPAKCPEGLLFDWNLLTCTVPEKAYCTGSRPPPSGEVKCPAGNDNAIIPDPKDCTKYYRCKGGIAIPTKCPEGLLFDWNLLTCTVPEKAYCKGSRPPPSGEVKCPAGNDNAIIPDPKDCTKYYSCKGGIPIPAKCPEGLLFDWNLLTCTVPEKAYCTGSRPPPSGEIKCPAGNDNAIIPDPKDCTKYYRCKGGIPIPAKCPEGLLFDWNLLTCTVPEKAYCTGSRPPPSGEIKCPAGNDNAIIPDPKDCTKYYSCKGGIPIPAKCPEGLLFDWNLLTCTVPEKAYCTGSRPPPSGEVTCPAGNDNAIIPDPKDCTKYYSCKEGVPIPAKCPEGLLFDWNLLTCTVPEKAYCKGSRPPPSGEVKCPVGNENAIIPDPKDCTTFYVCKGGIPIPTKCPEGMLFDWNLLICTVPEKAYCTGSRPPPVYPVTCPPIGSSKENILRRDPEDCHRYYQCANGEPISMKCPAGLFWNDRMKVCDYKCVR